MKYTIKQDNRKNMNSIMVTRELTEDMKGIIIKCRENMRDESGQLVPKQDTPDEILMEHTEYGTLPEEYAERTYNYYKIKQVNGKAALEDMSRLSEEKDFKAGKAVTIASVQLELIPYSDHSLYGIRR